MISNEKTYLFLLAFMIFSSASLYAIDDDDYDDYHESVRGQRNEDAVEIERVEAFENATIMISCGGQTSAKWFFNGLKSAEIKLGNVPKYSPFLELDCRVDENRCLLGIEWLKNDKPIRQKLSTHQQMMLRYPTQKDSGFYKCIAFYECSKLRSRIESQPLYVHVEGNNVVNDADNEIFVCDFNTNKIARPLEKTLMCRYEHVKGGRFHRKRSLSESGNQLSSKRRKITVDENNSATINCDVSRLERKMNQVSVRWKKDGKLIRQSMLNEQNTDMSMANPMENPLFRDDGRIIMDSKNGSITITSTIPSDSGIYECTLHRNGNGAHSVQVSELIVIEKLKFTPPPSSKGLEIGSVGKIHCKVQGTPTPQIQWTKDSTNTLPPTVEDVNGTLIFRNVSESDRGNYTCRATNNQGSINATVVVTPVIAPKFLVKPQGPIQVNEMGSVMIHCAATGDPKPKIQWDKDFDYLNISNSDTSRLNVLDNGTLYFTEVHLEDEGLYGCTIGSSAGLKREEAHLSVQPSEESISTDEQEGSFFVVRAVLITVTVVFSYIILVVGLMFWCRVKRKARKNRMQLIAKENMESSRNDTKPNDPNEENEPCLAERNLKKTDKGWNGISNGAATNNLTNEPQKTDNNVKHSSKSGLDQISFPRTILFDVTQIGRGDFGNIYTARVKFSDLKQHLHKDIATTLTIANECEQRKSNGSLENVNEIKEVTDDTEETVHYALIKALKKVKDENVCIEFRWQIDMFRTVSHRNVVKLFGLCRDKDPHYLVLEHTDLTDLKDFLMARKDQLAELTTKNGIVHKANSTSISLKLPQLLLFAQQIARGMDAIYRARYIHRDLAARNCIISSDLTVKVSYPAIIKDKYIIEYYKLNSNMVPLRWMAPECIEDDDNTIKSDVYSFGVLVLELFTFCSTLPVENLSDDDYLKQLQDNKIDRQIPTSIPEDISKSLLLCWKTNPKERPSFSTLNSVISKYLQQIDATTQAHT